jgi:NitT/TauT family transport system permease protein
MAQVFRISPLNRLLAIELPAVLPRLTSAAGVAIGLAWKSGVAAEVIGIPAGSVGERLYKAKVYLATPDLFAWTLTIVLASMLCERALRFSLQKAGNALERM